MTTRSKLGGVYPTSTIQAMDKEAHATLKQLRALPGNKECAECKTSPSTWASVSLGVFVCMDCAQVHRNLGAHISKVKSCMGTYLWCPDELERMKEIGNSRAWAFYTGGAAPGTTIEKPASGSSFEVRDRFVRDKYEAKKWIHPGGMAAVIAEERPRPKNVKQAPAPRVRKTPAANVKARRDARLRVQALRHGREDRAPALSDSDGADTRSLLSTAVQPADDDWESGDWGSWSPQPRVPAGRARAAPAPQIAMPPVVVPPAAAAVELPKQDSFDAFFRECVGTSSTLQQPSGSGSSTDLIDLFSPTPTSGLLARQVSAH